MPKKNNKLEKLADLEKIDETSIEGTSVEETLIKETGIDAKPKEKTIPVKKFTKNQIKRAKKFKNYADIITVCIKEDEMLTITQAQKRVEDFLKGKVK